MRRLSSKMRLKCGLFVLIGSLLIFELRAIDDKGNNGSNLHNDTYHENLPKLNTKNYKGILTRAVYV
jgi:hypothetical protein